MPVENIYKLWPLFDAATGDMLFRPSYPVTPQPAYVSLAQIATYIGDGTGAPLRIESPSTGATITLLATQRLLYIASGPLDALTIRLPPDPSDRILVELGFSTPITTLTVQDSAGTSVVGAPSSAFGPGAAIQFRWPNTWVYWK